jgi:ectoine hydroxylase-related dioxygenase (phytanoyl-CoA dioxygenase family)
MSNDQTWAQALNQRDIQSDALALGQRLEEFRDRIPTNNRTAIDDEANQPPWPDDSPVPEVSATDFDARKLQSAMASSGGLIVRNFINIPTTRYYKSIIDEVLSTCYLAPKEEHTTADSKNVFHNPPSNLDSLMPAQKWKNSRGFHRKSGSAMCIESSGVAEQLLELYEQKGLREIMTSYLGEPPCLSALKWVLRRSLLPVNPAGWHQDGAFMGSDINSINMWIPLDECGGDTGAPGLDLLPRRLKEIVNTGTDGAVFNWSTSDGEIDESFGEGSIISPVFNAGDAFFFDHFYLHRTQFKESFSKLRYAIETWFFSSGNFPKNQIPLSW